MIPVLPTEEIARRKPDRILILPGRWRPRSWPNCLVRASGEHVSLVPCLAWRSSRDSGSPVPLHRTHAVARLPASRWRDEIRRIEDLGFSTVSVSST